MSEETKVQNMSDEDLQKLANMVGSMKNNVSVIKIGNDVTPDKEQIERYKKSNQQLRRKIERNISTIVKLEAEVRELQADAYLNTDEGMEGVIKKLREQKSILKDQLDRSLDSKTKTDISMREMSSENSDLKSSNTSLKTKIDKLEESNKNLKKEVEDLKEEVATRIQADTRFNNMDL